MISFSIYSLNFRNKASPRNALGLLRLSSFGANSEKRASLLKHGKLEEEFKKLQE